MEFPCSPECLPARRVQVPNRRPFSSERCWFGEDEQRLLHKLGYPIVKASNFEKTQFPIVAQALFDEVARTLASRHALFCLFGPDHFGCRHNRCNPPACIVIIVAFKEGPTFWVVSALRVRLDMGAK